MFFFLKLPKKILNSVWFFILGWFIGIFEAINDFIKLFRIFSKCFVLKTDWKMSFWIEIFYVSIFIIIWLNKKLIFINKIIK
jgi:hypothetical protein